LDKRSGFVIANAHQSAPALRDVAQAAGVGAATVSRVINGGRNVSPGTLARVTAVMQQLGYFPSQAARSLKSSRTCTIGLVVPSVAVPFFSSAASTSGQVAAEHGSLLLLATSGNDAVREREIMTALIERRVDGLILAPSDQADDTLLRHARFPTVCFDRPLQRASVPVVLADNFGGARAATEHLVRNGRRRILCMGGDAALFTSRSRLRGYRQAVQRARLPEIAEINVQDLASTRAALLPHLRSSRSIDAIFTIKNSVTVFAYEILRELGRDIGPELALLGFDDLDLAHVLEPPISVVRQPVEAMARRTAELLFESMQGHEHPAKRVVMPVELVERDSCGRGSQFSSNLPSRHSLRLASRRGNGKRATCA